MVTMKEISLKAGVAQQTVSKILNGRDPDISEQTREKVQAIARELNYRPNYMASSLKKGRTDTIGFLGEEISFDVQYVMSNNMVAAGIESALPDDKSILIFSSNGEKGIEKSLALARRGVVDGMIVKVYPVHYGRLEKVMIPVFNSIGLPFVVVHPTSAELPCAHVGINREPGGYLTARHLLDKGIRDIKMVMPPPDRTGAAATLAGVARAFGEQGLAFGPERIIQLEKGGNGAENEPGPLQRTFAGQVPLPRALIFHNTYVAEKAWKIFTARGVRVPEDLIIAGYGHLNPGTGTAGRILVTGVPLKEQGHAAAGMLLDMLGKKSGAAGPLQSLLLEPRII